MTLHRTAHAIAAITIATFAPQAVTAESLRILAAASMTEVVEALAVDFSQNHPETEIETVFAGSGVLARQIQQGVPADIYISANSAWVAWLRNQDIGIASQVIASNSLVWIGLSDDPAMQATQGSGRIALADPDAVPAGQYARQSLIASDEWNRLDGRLIFATNVRDALGWVVRGHAPFGIVYATDALAYPELSISPIAAATHDPILYESLTLTAKAAEFSDYLISDEAQDILASFGFLPSESE